MSDKQLSKSEEQQAQYFANMLDNPPSKILYEVVIAQQKEMFDKAVATGNISSYERVMERASELEKPGKGYDMAVWNTVQEDRSGAIEHLIGLNKTALAGKGVEITLPFLENQYGISERVSMWNSGVLKISSMDGTLGLSTGPVTLKSGTWGQFELHSWGPTDKDNYDEVMDPTTNCTTRTYAKGGKTEVHSCDDPTKNSK